MMSKKKLMLLGGIRYLLPAIETAHRNGYYVITVDYIPNNIAHKYSDEYHNISILDKEIVLRLAKEKKIDGILSFAVDPGVVTAAYVAEQMMLPFSCSFDAACVLQNKTRFREFMTRHNFNVPKAKGYNAIEDVIKDVDYFNWPIIVKPVDSAGSKGVSRVDSLNQLSKAIEKALATSHDGHFIVEDFLEKDGSSSGSESFFVDGKLMYNGFYDQFFDTEAANPFTPSGECWPSAKSDIYLNEVRGELQRLGDLLHFGTGLFNVEWRVCKDGKVYLMEISPRAGGNRLAEMLNYAADVDLIDAEVRKAVGDEIAIIHEPNYNGYYMIYVIHCEKDGIFGGLDIDDCIMPMVIEKEIRVGVGDKVEAFSGANSAIGSLFLRFDSQCDMERYSSVLNKYIRVNIQ